MCSTLFIMSCQVYKQLLCTARSETHPFAPAFRRESVAMAASAEDEGEQWHVLDEDEQRRHRILLDEELEKLIDLDDIIEDALERTEAMGIIFLDEIDKIAGERGQGGGPDVSREGVQRDLLPIVEGSNVQTKYGMVKTDHILFIAAGAFHVSKPSDLIPELQGRFPIRVELKPLTEQDFVRIMTEPENALTKQYKRLFDMEGASLEFRPDALSAIAKRALERKTGARGLRSILEAILLGTMYELPSLEGVSRVVVDEKVVLGETEPLLVYDNPETARVMPE